MPLNVCMQFTNTENNKILYSLSFLCSDLYTATNKYCTNLLKMHISNMFSSQRACSCQNFGPKLSVSQLSRGQSLRFNLSRLPGNVFTAFIPLRCTARLIHHSQNKKTQHQQPSSSTVWTLCKYRLEAGLLVRILVRVAAHEVWGKVPKLGRAATFHSERRLRSREDARQRVCQGFSMRQFWLMRH